MMKLNNARTVELTDELFGKVVLSSLEASVTSELIEKRIGEISVLASVIDARDIRIIGILKEKTQELFEMAKNLDCLLFDIDRVSKVMDDESEGEITEEMAMTLYWREIVSNLKHMNMECKIARHEMHYNLARFVKAFGKESENASDAVKEKLKRRSRDFQESISSKDRDLAMKVLTEIFIIMDTEIQR